MFCPKCGSQIPDNAAVCPQCGENLGAVPGNSVAQNNAAFDNGNAKGSKNKIIVAAVAVVAVIVVVILISVISGGNYKDPVKQLVKLCNKREESVLAYNEINHPKYLADFEKVYEEAMANSDYDDDYKDTYEYVFDSWEDEYGDDFKLTVEEIKNVEKIDKDDLKDIQEDFREYDGEDKDDRDEMIESMEDSLEYFEDEYDLSKKDSKKILSSFKKLLKKMSKAKVTKGYEMDIEIKIQGEDGKARFKEKHVEVIKVNGDWIFSGTYDPSILYYGFE